MLYLAVSRQLFRRETWRRLRPFSGALIVLAIAAPWHVLATCAIRPYLYFGMHSGPGQYHGFFWFYFFNEHLLRFLNRRYPHDYNTVPRLYFWLFHLIWLFPWSAYFPALFQLRYQPLDRAGRTRLVALCWTGFLLLFFSFSSTQEYYSMPCYPALALLLGSAMTKNSVSLRRGNWALVRHERSLRDSRRGDPRPGLRLCRHRATYRTRSPPKTRMPIPSPSATWAISPCSPSPISEFRFIVAGLAFCIGASAFLWKQPYFAFALMMVIFIHAARLAMVTFDPYLSSRPLATALLKAPPWTTHRRRRLLHLFLRLLLHQPDGPALKRPQDQSRIRLLWPGAPQVFIDDPQFARLWPEQGRYYLLIEGGEMPRIRKLAQSPERSICRSRKRRKVPAHQPCGF